MGWFKRRTEADNVALAGAREQLTSDDVDQIRFLLTTKKTVFAVKYVMDRTGIELKHARDLVEDIRLGRYVPPVGDTPVLRRPGTNLAERTRALKAALRRRLPELDHLDDPRWLEAVRNNVAGSDLIKTTVGLSRYSLTGFEVAEALVQRGIVIEKAGVQTITLITTFQLRENAVEETVEALCDILGSHELPGHGRQPMPGNPFAGIDDRPVIRPYDAKRLAKSIGYELPLREAIGKVAAEEVEVYPPGIPLILEGFRVGADAVAYLEQAKESGGSIVARDTSLQTVRVL
jgi:lysine decarboxylase